MKQQAINRWFSDIIGSKITGLNFISNADIILWLIMVGIIKEKDVLRFMSIWIYRKEIRSTRSKLKPNGCEGIAVANTAQKIPLSERSIRENQKKSSLWFSSNIID